MRSAKFDLHEKKCGEICSRSHLRLCSTTHASTLPTALCCPGWISAVEACLNKKSGCSCSINSTNSGISRGSLREGKESQKRQLL